MKYSIEFNPPSPSNADHRWFYTAERYLESIGRKPVAYNSHLKTIVLEGENKPRIIRVRVNRLLDGFGGGEPQLPPRDLDEMRLRTDAGVCERFTN
jgi:hypothetical protein